MISAKENETIAVVIISNGPGELETWVKPVVRNLKKILTDGTGDQNINLSIRLALVPCPNANGNEFKVATQWELFELVTPAKSFWRLLYKPSLFGKWPEKGVIVFLGGDQFWSVLLSKRLGYKNITYAEWIARWPRWNAYIAAMSEKVKNKLPKKYKSKCIVIGDLMRDLSFKKEQFKEFKDKEWLAILPGSKKSKLLIGIPFFLEMADKISAMKPTINLMIPLASTIEVKDFYYYLSDKNIIAKKYSASIKSIKKINNSIFDYVLETQNNSKLFILSRNPNYEILSQCKLAVTTVGANTAELAAIQVPMIVVLPTQHLNVMQSWDGIFGIFGKISFINHLMTFFIKRWYIKKKKFFAWPNIKAGKLIVPERIGIIFPKDIAKEVIFLMNNKKLLDDQKFKLSEQRGNDGAAKKLVKLILKLISQLVTYQGSSISNALDD